MKKISFVLSLFLLSIGLFGCQQNSKSIEKITIDSMESNTETIVIEDTKTIEKIKEVFEKAEKQPGIVNMADPEYKVEVGEETYFLWIEEKSGTIMNTEDSHTIYSLSYNSIKQMDEFLN
ncbi:hypothetical protein HNQ94_000141 [Salirhabdus euzebyi]|uniref:YhfM-like domain-containing protein n=1 Tax=Salirhabdus euzebyi TaxID=394506 RepID=A0A841PSF5_9BACI|nr:hypothetical protein [Salirhabdus euzebyi]MBB6451720.1 hypothetical protein [Salirhabdus euzebyi]